MPSKLKPISIIARVGAPPAEGNLIGGAVTRLQPRQARAKLASHAQSNPGAVYALFELADVATIEGTPATLAESKAERDLRRALKRYLASPPSESGRAAAASKLYRLLDHA